MKKGFTLISKACDHEHGFTLIELLVVISLIGILSTLLVVNFNAARQRSRDAQRKSDLKNLQTALRLYYNDQGAYPESDSAGKIRGCGSYSTPAVCEWAEGWEVGGSVYMNTLPSDPVKTQSYRYSLVDLDNYLLQACLENKSDEKGVVASDTTWCPSEVMYEVRP